MWPPTDPGRRLRGPISRTWPGRLSVARPSRSRRPQGATLCLPRYPARFQLLLAANPCPCASAGGDQACICPSRTRSRYLAKLSGPLLDRIDLQVELLPVTGAALLGQLGPAEPSAAVAKRVAVAR